MPFSAISRKAAGTSIFGISNFGISNLGISNLGDSTAGAATATGFGLGVEVVWVLAMTVILTSEDGFRLKASRRPRYFGPRLMLHPPRLSDTDWASGRVV